MSVQPVAGPSTNVTGADGPSPPKRPRRVPRPRTSTTASIPQKLKLKLSSNAQNGSGINNYMQGYDRELDSDVEEPLAFEEQFILRLPPGEDCERLREAVTKREVGSDVWFKFKDSRRAVFHIGDHMYGAKLVDLPCIVESQKTLDNKHMFKVADISQMLLVEDMIPDQDESKVTDNQPFNIDDFIYPHGITPPLQHVRRRRFRKRVNKRTIETVEKAVERLLEEDSKAEQVQYEVIENLDDMSDSEYAGTPRTSAATPGPYEDGGESVGAPTPAPEGDEGIEGEEEEEEEDNEFDADLAAEIDRGLEELDFENLAGDENGNQKNGVGGGGVGHGGDGGVGDVEDEDDEDDDLFGGRGGGGESFDEGDESDDSDDEEDEEDGDTELAEAKSKVRLLQEEVRDLENTVGKKKGELAASSNQITKRRHEDLLKRLTAELDSKKIHLNQAIEAKSKRKAEKNAARAVAAAASAASAAADAKSGSNGGGNAGAGGGSSKGGNGAGAQGDGDLEMAG